MEKFGRGATGPVAYVALETYLKKQIGRRTILAALLSPACTVRAESRMYFAQNDSDSTESFETASIKPVKPGVMHMTGADVQAGGRVHLGAMSLAALIQVACRLSFWQIQGVDEWMKKAEYDIDAVPPESVRPMLSTRHTLFGVGDDRIAKMLQNLLVSRFGLRFHWETQIGKVYFLEVTKSGRLAIEPNPDLSTNSAGSIGWAGGWTLGNTTMPELAKFAADHVLYAPVLDHTGVLGRFVYRGEREDENTSMPEQTTSFLSMLKAIGLRLKPGAGDVKVFVIDAAHPPSPD